ncbi:hypothetical protein M8818_000608 [Zalaria obscura]|uniref:Uncharacterized protein n=1 Tax=Zalaria obscura TaxID=2024903 RepID=A0ACC3SM63_9PEZI
MDGLGENMDYELDVLGQQLMRIYTQITLCFPIHDDTLYEATIATLETGLERLSKSFPWVAGQVVNEGAGRGDTGTFKIKYLARTPELVVKDLRNDPSLPSTDELREANFPMSVLDESIVCPVGTRPKDLHVWPVFVLQATYVRRGLLLSFVTQHQAMDMTGQNQLMQLLHKACHNHEFTHEELSLGNARRCNTISLLDDPSALGPDFIRKFLKPAPPKGSQQSPEQLNPQCEWVDFKFSAASLSSLKLVAMQSVSRDNYISTDDALSAFLWQSITRARLQRMASVSSTTLGRTVDMRRYLQIPATYSGMAVTKMHLTYASQKLVEEPLGSIALQLRSLIDPSTLAYNTRAFATALHHTKDKATLSPSKPLDLSSDVMLSSWAKYDMYSLDFNLGLGSSESIRRPQFFPAEGLLYALPRKHDGEITVAICLRKEDMEGLKADRQWLEYASYSKA